MILKNPVRFFRCLLDHLGNSRRVVHQVGALKRRHQAIGHPGMDFKDGRYVFIIVNSMTLGLGSIDETIELGFGFVNFVIVYTLAEWLPSAVTNGGL